jgi:hypothetical protein
MYGDNLSGQTFACDTAEEPSEKNVGICTDSGIVYFGKEANTVTLNDETFLFSFLCLSDVIEKHTQLHLSVFGR